MNQMTNRIPNHARRPKHETNSNSQRILDAAVAILAQGEELLQGLVIETYTRRSSDVFDASIAGHYRHCLDHFTSVLRALDAEEVDYDDRDRDLRIESSPEFALTITRQLRAGFEGLPPDILNTPLNTRCKVSYARGESPVTSSSWGRELVYCIAHAIHHYALISVIARLTKISLPVHFGVAPSTVAHQESNRLETAQLH